MNNKFEKLIKLLYIGQHISSNLDNSSDNAPRFSGIIYHKSYSEHNNTWIIDIKRDDKLRGSGKDRTWRNLVTSENFQNIEITVKEWDE